MDDLYTCCIAIEACIALESGRWSFLGEALSQDLLPSNSSCSLNSNPHTEAGRAPVGF